MNSRIIDLIDFEKINILLEGFNKSTGFVTAILDLEGNVLSKSGWRNICVDFHRVNPKTAHKCKISDTELAGKMADGEKYHFYKCLNGLVDVAVPVVIQGQHIANLFTGQFFFEEPDRDFFIQQAAKYKFKQSDYLSALKEVPVVSQEKVRVVMDFLLNMTELIAEMTLQRLEQIQLNESLKKNQLTLKIRNNELEEAREKTERNERYFENIINNMGDPVFVKDEQSCIILANDALCSIFNLSREEIIGKTLAEDVLPEEQDSFLAIDREVLSSGTENINIETLTIRGRETRTISTRKTRYIDQEGHKFLIGIIRDLTELKQAEAKIKESESNLISLINNTTDSIWSLDRNYNYIIYNTAYANVFRKNYGFDVKIGMNAKDLLTPKQLLFWEEMYEAVFSGEKRTFEFNHLIDGELRYFQTSINPIFEEGQITGASAISVDITAIKTANQAIAESNLRFKSLFNESPFPLCEEDFSQLWFYLEELKKSGISDFESYFDQNPEALVECTRKFKIQEVNQAALELHQAETKEELIRNFDQTLTDDFYRFFKDLILSITEGQQKFEGETTIKTLKGESRTVHLNIRFDPSKPELQSATMATMDLTGRKAAEKKMREAEDQAKQTLIESERRYRNLFENMNAGFVLFEVVQDENDLPVDLIIIAANEGFEATTGLKNEFAIGKRLTEVLPGIQDDDADWVDIYSEVALTGKSIQFEQGSELLGVYYSVTAFQSEPKRCAITFIDISEKKLGEKALRESEEKYRSIYENSNVAILLTTPDGQILSANDFACKIFERTEEEILEIGRDGLIDQTDPRLPVLLHERELNGRTKGELNFLKKDGTKFACELSSVLFQDKEGKQKTSLVLRDLTEEKLAKQEITTLNQNLERRVAERTEQLRQANKDLESFSYSISHDLRAPLRAIFGFSQILASRHAESLNEEGKQFLEYVVSASKRMEQLINDLLSYSRLGRKAVQIQSVQLQNIVEGVSTDFNAELEKLGGALRVVNPLHQVQGDETLLHQIFSNLVGNAIKYRRPDVPPEIRIESQSNNDGILVKIRDNGIGISEKHFEKIFNVFQRLHSEQEYSGTGIGLANVQKAVSILGGKIWLESVVGEGTTFFLNLPKTQFVTDHD